MIRATRRNRRRGLSVGRRGRSGRVPRTGHQPAEFDARVDQEYQGRAHHVSGRSRGRPGSSTPALDLSIFRKAPDWYAKVNYGRTPQGELLHQPDRREGAESPPADPITRQPLQLNFSTQTYDSRSATYFRVGTRQVSAVGGERAPEQLRHHHCAERRERNELGPTRRTRSSYDKVRFTVGGRVDKFGNLSDPVFSPRLARCQAGRRPAVRVSFNRRSGRRRSSTTTWTSASSTRPT